MIYVATAVYVFRKASNKVDNATKVTFAVFLACYIFNLGVYTTKLLYPLSSPALQIAFVLSQFGLYCVLIYYTFQIKLVVDTATCED
jgi:hypothetical protein